MVVIYVDLRICDAQVRSKSSKHVRKQERKSSQARDSPIELLALFPLVVHIFIPS